MLKRNWIFAICLIISLSLVSPVLGSSGTAKEDIKVQINGVDVIGDATHWVPGRVWVDAIAYAELLEEEYDYDQKNQSFVIKGEKLEVKIYKGKPTVHIRAIADATGAEYVTWDRSGDIWLAYVLDLPEGTIGLEGSDVNAPGVPGMGQHWANPAELPLGPIFGVEKGRLVFIEQMVSQEDFANGVSHVNIPGMKGKPSPAIVHTDLEFVPNGHPGFEVPHFDIHHYFVTHEEHLKFSLPPEGGEVGHQHN